MDPVAPIQGITLERYAELTAELEGVADRAARAEVLAKLGVLRAVWERASAGWALRLSSPQLAPQLADRFAKSLEAARVARAARAGYPPAPAGEGYAPPPPGKPMTGPHAAYPDAYPLSPAPDDRHSPPPPVAAAPPQAGGYVTGPQPMMVADASGFAVGATVMVNWSDGQKYRAQVLQSIPGKAEVKFPDGRKIWVENKWISPI